jgi:hypothetical protein
MNSTSIFIAGLSQRLLFTARVLLEAEQAMMLDECDRNADPGSRFSLA